MRLLPSASGSLCLHGHQPGPSWIRCSRLFFVSPVQTGYETWMRGCCFLQGLAFFPFSCFSCKRNRPGPVQLVCKTQSVQMFATYLSWRFRFFSQRMSHHPVCRGRDVPKLYAADLLARVSAAWLWCLLCIWDHMAAPPSVRRICARRCRLGSARGMGGRGTWFFPRRPLILACYATVAPVPQIHHTKALPMTMAFPDARVEAERDGRWPTVVGSSSSGRAGLSLKYSSMGRRRVLRTRKRFFQTAKLSMITR